MASLKTNLSARIDWIQAGILIIIAPFFIFPSSKSLGVTVIIPILMLARWFVKGEILENTILDWPILVLVGQVLAFCLRATELSFSLSKILNFLYGILFYFMAISLMKSAKAIRWGTSIFLGGGLAIAFVGLLGMMEDHEKIISTFFVKIFKYVPHVNWKLPGAELGINSNPLAGIILLILPLGFILLKINGHRSIHCPKRRPFYWKAILLVSVSLAIAFVLFFTESILGWIAFILSFWILGLNRKRKIASVLVFAALLSVLSFVKHDEFSSWTQKIKIQMIQEKFSQRFALWPYGIAVIQQHPWFGVGMNRIRLLPEIGYETAHVHNHFINLAAEMGLPALVAYLALLMGAGYMCYMVWKISKIPWMKAVSKGLATGQLAHLFFGIGDSIPLGAKPGLFFWFSLALIAAMYNFVRINQPENPITAQTKALGTL